MYFLFKQKTAYEMRISDWSSDVCSSDFVAGDDETFRINVDVGIADFAIAQPAVDRPVEILGSDLHAFLQERRQPALWPQTLEVEIEIAVPFPRIDDRPVDVGRQFDDIAVRDGQLRTRSEEHTSELQSLMRISYAVFCLKK